MKRLKVFKSRNEALDAYFMWLEGLIGLRYQPTAWKGRIHSGKDRITGEKVYAVSIVIRNKLTNQTFTRLLLQETNEDYTQRRI